MMTKVALTDDELWRNVAADDQQSFDILYSRYWLKIYKTALVHLKDINTSEEVVHDVFMLLWNKRKHLAIHNIKAYLIATTRYEVYRKMKVVNKNMVDFYEECPSSGKVVFNEGYEKINTSDYSTEVEQCLQNLPKRCREIYYLSRVELLNNGQIAERLDISKHTVENQLATALKQLRIYFSKAAIFVLTICAILY